MKKSLIAVAVAAALPAAAFAQSNVTMYGIADASIEFVDNGGTSDSDLRISSSGAAAQSGSRWGVRGEEDLGGGLAATFVFEAGFALDTGASGLGGPNGGNFLSRQAYVGLKGGFGSVRFGRQYSPIFYSSIKNDFSGFGWYNNQYGIAGSDGRLSNMMEYRNKFGGFEIIGAWAPGEQAADATGAIVDPDDVFGIAAIYQSGAWGINGGYHDEGNETVAAIGANVGFGPVKLGLNYGLGDRTDNTERTDINFSLGLKVGASGEAVLNVLTREDDGAAGDGLAVGLSYGHAMSKRTNWYTTLGFTDNDNAADTALAVAVGIRHRF